MAAGQTEDMCIDEAYSENEEDDEHEDLRPADTRLMLSQLFKPTLTNALEELYPRITNATVWIRHLLILILFPFHVLRRQ